MVISEQYFSNLYIYLVCDLSMLATILYLQYVLGYKATYTLYGYPLVNVQESVFDACLGVGDGGMGQEGGSMTN